MEELLWVAGCISSTSLYIEREGGGRRRRNSPATSHGHKRKVKAVFGIRRYCLKSTSKQNSAGNYKRQPFMVQEVQVTLHDPQSSMLITGDMISQPLFAPVHRDRLIYIQSSWSGICTIFTLRFKPNSPPQPCRTDLLSF